MGWPTESELINYLTATGLYSLSPSDAQALLDLSGALDAAVESWNDRTRYWPFMSDGTTNETRYFDPPDGMLLDLNGGLITFTSFKSDVSHDATSSLTAGTDRVSVRDFRLMPTDAANCGKPWTYIRLGWIPKGDPGSIAVTGEWGYCRSVTLPESARRAVLALAAMELAPQIEFQASRGGLKKLQQGDSTKEWADTGTMMRGWELVAGAAVRRYRRERIA